MGATADGCRVLVPQDEMSSGGGWGDGHTTI